VSLPQRKGTTMILLSLLAGAVTAVLIFGILAAVLL
jgi:hypothetical protein